MGRKRKKILRAQRFERELRKVVEQFPRAEEALRGFEEVVSRHPEIGMSVRGQPTEVCGLPFHTEQASFLVIYRYDEEKVVCLGVRRVPSGQF